MEPLELLLTRKMIAESSLQQLKDWMFALAWRMRKKVLRNSASKFYEPLYKLAKEFIGTPSVSMMHRRYMTNIKKQPVEIQFYVEALVDSVKMMEREVRLAAAKKDQNYLDFVHEEWIKRDWADVTTVLKNPHTKRFCDESVELARDIYKAEDLTILGVLGDRLEDEGAMGEADHFRTPGLYHTITCPVLTKIRNQE